MGPKFLSFASTVDAFATFIAIMVSFINTQATAPGPAMHEADDQVQRTLPLNSCRGSELLGREVTSADGTRLGQLDDLVLDPQSGQLTHLVVAPRAESSCQGKSLILPFNPSDADLCEDLPMQVGSAPVQVGAAAQREESIRVDVTREAHLTQMISKPVTSASGSSVGTMHDLVFDSRGKVVYGLLKSADPTQIKLITVPWSALELDRGHQSFVLEY